MPDTVWVEVDNRDVHQALIRLLDKVNDPAGELIQIGELMIDRTKQRFVTSTAPDGTPWPENQESTLVNYLSRFDSAFHKKTGKITEGGAALAMNKKPLIGETTSLSTQIVKKLIPGGVQWGSNENVLYAAMQQFGGKKSQFPKLWGDIPARPFLGVSAEDTDDILRILYRGIGEAWDGG